MTRRMVTVFPDPDSPTMASVSPRLHGKGDIVQDRGEPAVDREAQGQAAGRTGSRPAASAAA
ncbi:MAG: hypothetical protein MZV70_28625 [Desulfobacterales bacterium]|nr:hypothetical protein [Desulfobacterales bacterium]